MNPKYSPVLFLILLLLIQVVPVISSPPPLGDAKVPIPSAPLANPINRSSEIPNPQPPVPKASDSSINSVKPAAIIQPVNPPQQLESDFTVAKPDPLPPIPPLLGPDLGPLLDALVFLFIVLAILIIAFYFIKNFLAGKQIPFEGVSNKTGVVGSPVDKELTTVMRDLLEEIRKLRKEIKELKDEMRE